MNRLKINKRTQVAAALVEGTSINATSRITGVAKHTILKRLKDLGCAAASYHKTHVRNLRVCRLQCDEIWAFVGAKMGIRARKGSSANAVEDAFGADIDHAMLVKIYGASNDSPESRYSPATCI